MGQSMNKESVLHTLKPIYDSHSTILLLGSMPSPKSRETQFYYGHPQNRFWKVLSSVFSQPLPTTNAQKEEFLLSHHIALWDVLASCQIHGADDSSIEDPQPNNINLILKAAPIQAIFATGSAAYRYYNQLCKPNTNRPIFLLPSTSAANCRHYNLERLIQRYQILKEYTL